MKNLIYLGHVAVFYVPIPKLDNLEFGKDGKTPRQIFEEFLMDNYNAYTIEISDTQGFWRQHRKSPISCDANARYEISFNGKNRIHSFVDFLAEMCQLLHEQAIYLTMGHKSWLVTPRSNNEI